MGNLQALSYAEAVTEGSISLETALAAHLTSNHFPPVGRAWIRPCVIAIEKANRGEWDASVRAPKGFRSQVTGTNLYPVRQLIEGLHLEAFLEPADI